MIDLKARRMLSQDIRRLITGQITTDAFDDIYFSMYSSSSDQGIREVGAYCQRLYGEGFLPYRLRGRYALDAEARSAAARSILFLRSDREYTWPIAEDDPLLSTLAGVSMFFGFPLGVALSLIGIPFALIWPDELSVTIAILGIFVLAASIGAIYSWHKQSDACSRSFEESGDVKVWPFMRLKDFDKARQSCHMFGKPHSTPFDS